jgi:hypothetical protein
MVVAPITRCLEVAGPDAQAILAGGRLLDPVSTRSDCEPLGNHGSTKITTGNPATGQQPVELIDIFGAAIGGTVGQQLCHAVTRRATAGPDRAIGTGAVLAQLRRVEAQEPDTTFPQAEAVTVTGAAVAGNRRGRRIERGRNQRRNGQQANGQERPAGATKERVAMAKSAPDFITR